MQDLGEVEGGEDGFRQVLGEGVFVRAIQRAPSTLFKGQAGCPYLVYLLALAIELRRLNP